MSKVFYIMGKSASGKDAIYSRLLEQQQLRLKPLVIYTTRPIRKGEREGVEYHFTDEAHLQELQAAGKVIELRMYPSVFGPWYYFTVDDGSFGLSECAGETGSEEDILAIGTLTSYKKMRDYLGEDKVIPIYIEAADDIRLERAIKRERKQQCPNYNEVCRRFLADAQDFSEEKLLDAGIGKRFLNESSFEDCLTQVTEYMNEEK